MKRQILSIATIEHKPHLLFSSNIIFKKKRNFIRKQMNFVFTLGVEKIKERLNFLYENKKWRFQTTLKIQSKHSRCKHAAF